MTTSTGAWFWRAWGCPGSTYQVNHMIFILFSENIFQLQVIGKQSARIHQSLILCGRLAGVNVGEVRLQPAHGPVQKAVDGLVGVLLVGRLDDEGHRVAHHALLHAAGPAPLPPPGTRSRSEPRALGMGSARGAELPQATGGAHPRAGRAGRGAARRGTRGPPTANRHHPRKAASLVRQQAL